MKCYVLQIMQELHSEGLAWRDASLSNAMCETDGTGIPNLTAIDLGALQCHVDVLKAKYFAVFIYTHSFIAPR